jgi:hypothetical protein
MSLRFGDVERRHERYLLYETRVTRVVICCETVERIWG